MSFKIEEDHLKVTPWENLCRLADSLGVPYWKFDGHRRSLIASMIDAMKKQNAEYARRMKEKARSSFRIKDTRASRS